MLGSVLFAALWVSGVRAGDVAACRGPQNNGIYEETGLLKAWPAEGPKFLWKQMLGEGYGGPSVVDGIVWIFSDANGHLYGFTLDGELKHKYPVGGTSWKRFTGPRCTPVIRNGYLLCDIAGNAICLKLNADGTGYTPLWARPHGGFSHAVILGNRAGDLFLRGYSQGNTDLIVTLDVRDNTLFSGAAVDRRVQHVVTAKELKIGADGLNATLLGRDQRGDHQRPIQPRRADRHLHRRGRHTLGRTRDRPMSCVLAGLPRRSGQCMLDRRRVARKLQAAARSVHCQNWVAGVQWRSELGATGRMNLNQLDTRIAIREAGTTARGATRPWGFGNSAPGACLPHGAAHPGPNTDRGRSNGYDPTRPIRGFAQIHVSGTGGPGQYGNFLLAPQLGLAIDAEAQVQAGAWGRRGLPGVAA